MHLVLQLLAPTPKKCLVCLFFADIMIRSPLHRPTYVPPIVLPACQDLLIITNLLSLTLRMPPTPRTQASSICQGDSFKSFLDVGRCQGREDQCLDGSCKETQAHDGQGDDEGHQEAQDSHGQLISHDVSEKSEAQGQGLGEVLEDVDGQQDRRWLDISGEVAQTLLCEATAEVGKGGEQAQGDGGVDVVGRRGQLTGRDLKKLPGDQGTRPIADEDEQEDGGHERNPGPVEGLAQVVLGNVRGEAQSHLLEVARTRGSTKLADRGLGVADDVQDADHAPSGEEGGGQERSAGEGRGDRGHGSLSRCR